MGQLKNAKGESVEISPDRIAKMKGGTIQLLMADLDETPEDVIIEMNEFPLFVLRAIADKEDPTQFLDQDLFLILKATDFLDDKLYQHCIVGEIKKRNRVFGFHQQLVDDVTFRRIRKQKIHDMIQEANNQFKRARSSEPFHMTLDMLTAHCQVLDTVANIFD